MTKRQMMYGGVVLLFLIGGGLLWTLFGTHTVSLTEDYVQRRVDAHIGKEFPVKGRAHMLVKTVKIASATVHIEDGQVTLFMDIEGKMIADKKFSLAAYAIGVPYYTNGEFYFKQHRVAIEGFTYEGSTPAERIEKFAKHIPSKRLRDLAVDKAPVVERWITDMAESAAMHTLERRPVYRLKDDIKGILVRASLESVIGQGERIVVTFSLWQLTITVCLGVIALIVAIAFLYILLNNPLLGEVISFLD